LEDVMDFYNRGGNPNPYLDPLMVPLNLSRAEKSQLVAFLRALSGPYPIETAPPLPNPKITARQLRSKFQGGSK